MTHMIVRQLEEITSIDREPLPTEAHNQGVTILRAVAWASVATLAVVALADWANSYFTWYRILVIAALQIMVITHPILWTLRLYQTHQDFMHPAVVGSLTFVVFHILLNPFAVTNIDILQIRGLAVSEGSGFMTTVVLSYMVVAVSWFSYCIGSSWVTGWAPVRPAALKGSSPATFAFLVVGLGYLAVGMVGNAAVLGGLSEYVEKMLRFYERSEIRELANHYGGFKWTILQKFLPLGLTLLALGLWIYTGSSKAKLLVMLSLAAFANILLSCATGGRGISLMVFFYSLPLFNAYIKRFSQKMIILVSGVLIGISFILGNLRSASQYGLLEATSPLDLFANTDKFIGFTVRYLTDFVGTITLVNEVIDGGVFWGETAFAGLTKLFGGPMPLTTEAEMWWRITGKYILINPRYGPPGELFFNFGWIGVVIGMALIGFSVGILGKAYSVALSEQSVRGGMMIVFASFTANFVVIGNLNYIPAYFIFFSVPFYFVFWYFRNRRC